MYLLAHIIEDPFSQRKFAAYEESEFLPILGSERRMRRDDSSPWEVFAYRRIFVRSVGNQPVWFCLMEPTWEADFVTRGVLENTANYLLERTSVEDIQPS